MSTNTNERTFRVVTTPHQSKTAKYPMARFNLPVAMVSALPEGRLVFEARFTDEGIALRYLGRDGEVKAGPRDGMAPPAWAREAQA